MDRRSAVLVFLLVLLVVFPSLASPASASSASALRGAKLWYDVRLWVEGEVGGYRLCFNITDVSSDAFTVDYAVKPLYGIIPDPQVVDDLLGPLASRVFFLHEAFEAFQANTTVAGSKTVGLTQALFYISPAMVESAATNQGVLYEKVNGSIVLGLKTMIADKGELRALAVLDEETGILTYMLTEIQGLRVEVSLEKALLEQGRAVERDPRIIAKAMRDFREALEEQAPAQPTPTPSVASTTITVTITAPRTVTASSTVTASVMPAAITITETRTVTVTYPDRSTLITQASTIAAVVSTTVTLLIVLAILLAKRRH